MNIIKVVIGFISLVCSLTVSASDVPRTFPVPKTVSPELQSVIEKPFVDAKVPQNNEEWITLRNNINDEIKASLPALRKYFGVKSRSLKIANIPVYWVSPNKTSKLTSGRVLLHLHGGGYVFVSGESVTEEAIYTAGLTGFKVISLDYRMAPEYPFPAALDDALIVYRELLKIYPANKIGVFGSSAGGGVNTFTYA